MAIKIFCNVCSKFIRDARVIEMKTITGTEICTECEKRLEFKMTEVQLIAQDAVKKIEVIVAETQKELSGFERITKKSIKAIEDVRQKIVAEINDAIKKVVSAEVPNAKE
jgi:carboxylesterase type B